MDNAWTKIKLQFLAYGVRSAKELIETTGISQASVSRALSEQSASIVRIGNARATRYGLIAPIEGYGHRWPLYCIDEEGNPEQIGTLHALAGRAWYLEKVSLDAWPTLTDVEFADGVFPDLPWFLDDARPQGFLGRAFARTYGSTLGEGRDPILWTSRGLTESLLRFGGDTPGAFVLGKEALTAALTARDRRVIEADARSVEYPLMALGALDGEVGGSSAGGEQPKFTTVIRQAGIDRHLIVKFSAPLDDAQGRRWADLLAAEQLASSILRENGISAAPAELHDFSNRRYLEVQRFDRTEHGRVAMVSLRALDAAFFGEPNTPWRAAADRLESTGWLDSTDAATLRTLWNFGELIGNSDMHYGNVSLFLHSDRPITLAPIYDMLPMALRPQLEGRLPGQVPEASPEAWRDDLARMMARAFWDTLSDSPDLSDAFRAIVRTHTQNFDRPVGEHITIATQIGAEITVPVREQGSELAR